MIGRFGRGWQGSIFSRRSLLVRGRPGENALERRAKLEGVGVLRLREFCASRSTHSAQDDIG